MQERIITVATQNQQLIKCPSCQAELAFSVIPHTQPHLYCIHCQNAYHETYGQAKHRKIWWERIANRELHEIQSHAPMCECGGLFLSSAYPHCTHCGYSFTFAIPTKPKARLLYGDLIVFHGSKVYLDNGTHNLYQFGA